MRTPLITLSLVALCLAMGSSLSGELSLIGVAYAQSPDEIERAKERFSTGKKRFDEQRFDEAAAIFLEAYNLSKRPGLLYYVAQSYERADALLEAQRYYKRYLDEMPDAPNAEEVVESILSIQQRISEELGRVDVETVVEGREVFVGGQDEPFCVTPCAVILKPGTHTLSVRTPGEAPIERPFTLRAGQRERWEAKLAQAPRGTLLVRTDAKGATLRVADKTHALPLEAPLILPVGAQSLELRDAKGALRWRGEQRIEADQLAQLMVPILSEGDAGAVGWRRVGAYTLLSAGAGVLIGGLLMGSQASASHDALEAQQRRGAIDPDLVSRGQSQQTTANALFATSGLLLAAGAGVLTWDLLDGTSADDEVAPPSEPEPAPNPDDDLL